ncbi:MAG: branched-chain amino acid ABC transporter substrate-binding protein [Anaerolineae bacterium]|nr:branched-chain amino acid ABC transporter substrate-binding protein [Anaerolineae bacterium]
MPRKQYRSILTMLAIFLLVVAACSPAEPTATPTSVPPTEAPTLEPTEAEAVEETEVAEEPTEEMTEVVTEEATEEMATEEATEEGVEVAMADVTEEATEEMAEVATEEATEEMATEEAMTEEPTEEVMAEEPTEEPTEEMMAEMTEEPTEEAMVEEAMTEEPTEEATEEMMAEMTEEPTEEAAMEATEEMMAEMGSSVMVSPDDAITIGLATILSGEGLVPLGEDIQRGVEIAIAERGGVTVDGQEFAVELDVQDDQCSAEGGQAVANRFVSDSSIVAVVGPTCSSACRASGPIFDDAGYTSISSSCTAPDLNDFSSFNRTAPSDLLQGAVAAEFIYNELGITQIATIHDGSPYGEGLVEVLTQRFEELGGEIVATGQVTVGDTDFRNLLDDISDSDPGLIYFGGFPAEAARLAEQRADAGLDDVPFMGADGILTSEYINLAGSAAEGTYASSAVAAESDAYTEFLTKYEDEYGLEPTGPYHAYGYDAANMVLDAIEAVGTIDDNGDLVVDRAALQEYIRAYGSDEPVAGLTGELSCDGTGNCATGGIGFFQAEGGEFVQVGAAAADETTMEATEEAMDEMEATEEATEEASE